MSISNGRTIMVQGRIVWVSGDLFKGRMKQDFNTKQPVIDAKTGQPKMEYGFGLAIPKSALGQPGDIWTALHEEAYTLFPSRQIPPAFAMKYKDGDGIDDKGVSFAQREGYAGHIVLACTTQLAIKFYRYENGQNFLINEGIKCGDYVNVQISVKAHPAQGQGKAGLYVNPMAVQFLGYGKEIINAPSGDSVFGSAAPAMPAGASAMPIAPAGMLQPSVPMGAPMAPMNNYAQNMQPAPAPQMAPAPAHYGVLPQIHQPAPQMAAPMPQAAPVPMGMPAIPGFQQR